MILYNAKSRSLTPRLARGRGDSAARLDLSSCRSYSFCSLSMHSRCESCQPSNSFKVRPKSVRFKDVRYIIIHTCIQNYKRKNSKNNSLVWGSTGLSVHGV